MLPSAVTMATSAAVKKVKDMNKGDTSIVVGKEHNVALKKPTVVASPEKDLRETVARLQCELDSERQLRREQSHQSKLLADQEHTKASVAYKELRAKLLAEKLRELDLHKETLQRKHEHELGKAVKQRESEVAKLRADLNKLQGQLAAEYQGSGLSANQRHAFEAERTRLTAETQDLRCQKRRLEDLVRTAQAAEKHMANELRQTNEIHKAELARLGRDADIEVKKLLEELKAKGRSISNLEKDSGAVQAAATIAKQQDMLVSLASEMAVWDREKRGQKMSDSTDSAMSMGSLGSSASSASATDGQPPDPGKPPPETITVPDDEKAEGDQPEASYLALTELRVKLSKTQELVVGLTQDKADVLKRIKEFEKKFKQSQEKNRKFLEKNMDLTNVNRNLEEKIKKLTEENNKLKSTVEKSKKEAARLNNRLNHDKQGKVFVDELTEEIEALKQQMEESNKTIEALKLSCEEKDRRIELLAHRRKKQRATKQQQKAAGIKETYYGYDDDTKSIDSENMSVSSSRMSSSRVSLDNTMECEEPSDDVFDEFTREEFEKNYQRLAKEHIELEKSFALLQAQNGHSHVDPQREVKFRTQLESDLLDAQTKIEDLEKIVQENGKKSAEQDTSWLEEKEKLNKTIRKLKEKLSADEESRLRLKASVQELGEQNEILEFRLLELEDSNEKLSEEVGAAILVTQHSALTSDGELLRVYIGDGEVQEIILQELRDNLMALRNNQSVSPSDRLLLLQTRAVLDISHRRISELSHAESALNQRIAQLEKEKAEIVAKETGLETDLILEYEATRNKLLQAQVKIQSLTDELNEQKKESAVFQYKEECTSKIEQRYRDEIAGLRRQVSSSSEGRQLESELWEEQIDKLKHAEATINELQVETQTLQKTISDLQVERETFEKSISDLQRECSELTEQLDTQSMTESEKDVSSHLKAKIMERQKSESELMEKNNQLLEEVNHFKIRLEEAEHNEGELTEQNMTMQDELESLHKRCNILQQELEITEEELEEAHRKCGHFEQEVELAQEKCTSTERELQLACLAMEKLKTGAQVDFDTAKVLQKDTEEITVLKSEIEGLREALEVKDKRINELARTKEVYEKEEEDLSYLKEHLEIREQEIEQLSIKVHKLQENENESSERILELLEAKDQLEAYVDELKNRTKEESKAGEEEKRLKAQVEELKVINQELQVNLTSLSANQSQCNISEHQELANETAAYKSTIENLQTEISALRERELAEKVKREEANEENLRETIRELEEDLEQARTQFEEAHEEFDHHDEELQRRIKTLERQLTELGDRSDDENNITLYEEKIEELEQDLIKARDAEEELRKSEEERDQRAKELQKKVDSMEENEKKLSETIEELKEIENGLKGKIVESEVDITEKERMMEEREVLKAKVEELEMKLKEVHEDSGMSNKLEKYESKMKELMERVDELTVRESDLMKDVYEMKMENQELQEQIEEILGEKGSASESESPRESGKMVDELKDRIRELTEENEGLKEQMFRSKLDRLDTIAEGDELAGTMSALTKELNTRIEELEKNEVDLKVNIKQANAEIEALNVELQEKGVKTKKMLEKLEVLEMSEDKLMEQLDLAEERNEKMAEEIALLKKSPSVSDSGIGKVADDANVREQDLLEEIERLKVEMDRGIVLKDKEELTQLRNKVDILIDTEEKLIDRLQSQEEVELKLKEKITELERDLKRERTLKEEVKDKKVDELSQTVIEELKDSESKLKAEIKKLEKAEVEHLAKITGQNGSLKEYEKNNAELHEQISKLKHVENALKHRITELERSETSLKSRIEDLNAEKKGLVSTLEAIGKTNTDWNMTPQIVLTSSSHNVHDSSILSAADTSLLDTLGTYVPLDPAQIQHMSREEMISKLHELEKMESFHRVKIRYLTENLDELRNAVEVVAVTMETETGIPIVKYRPKVRDSEFEARVQELVKSESAQKMRVMELEKREMQMKRELNEAESILKEQEQDFKDEIDELEDELNEVRKSEARLKNKLQYGQNSQPETPALAKILHLEELVCDLETSEAKLKRRYQESQQNEQDLKARLAAATSGGQNGIGGSGKLDWEERERKFTQEQQLRHLEAREKELEEELEVLRKDDNTEKLAKRVSELQRSEKGLRLKIDLLEAHTPSLLDSLTGNMLDTPEDILRQRIRELEKMENHQRQQVAELEKDREELHEIARSDKNTIHELSVQLREFQLRDKSLKEQLNRCEQSESLLQLRCDDLTERCNDLEEKLRQVTSSERSVRAQLEKHRHTQNDLSMKLEHSQEDLQSAESKLKKRIEELQKDKRALKEKCDELTDRIGDLEGAELTYKQKLRNVENNETQLKGRLSELEQRDNKNEQRRIDLEHFNDTLNNKLHQIEEEKANLLYTISDLEITKEENGAENNTLKSKMAAMERKIAEYENRKSSLESRLDEFTTKEVSMQSRLGETERKEKKLQESLEAKIKIEAKLKKRLEVLEAECVATDEKIKSASSSEKQLQFLQSQIEFHQRTQTQFEEENGRLKEKLHRYEQAIADKTMSQIPTAELESLRQQEKVLDDLEKSVSRLEMSEKSLKMAVDKLREGKEACGHEFELSELHAKLKETHNLIKAQELLKDNHEETKRQLSRLQSQVQNGDLNLKEAISTATKCIQVQIAETINLKGLTPEFKHALKSLGARHPQAYEEFVHHLQPAERQISHVRVSNTMATEQMIAPQMSRPTAMLPPGTTRPYPQRPLDSNFDERAALIGGLVDTMTTENPLWREVEGRRSAAVGMGQDDDYWEQLEKNMGDTDDMMLTINFGEENDSPSRPRSAASQDSSQASLPPPPLPGSQPPAYNRRSQSPGADSYYLPSADEASEIEDDNFGPRHNRYRAGSVPPPARARSQEPDSAYSEGMSLPTLGMGLPPRKGKNKRVSASLDSIPDDSGFQDVDMKMLKEKIAYLEGQVKVKENEVKVIHDDLKVKNNKEVQELKNKLNEKENQLALEKKVNQDQMDKLSRTSQELNQVKAEMDKVKAKSVHTPIPDTSVTLQLKGPDESTTNHMLIKTQLDRKERELTAKNNEVDRLSTELRRWQQDCRDAKDDKTKAEFSLNKLQDQMQGLQEDSERLHELEKQHEHLQKEHDEILARLRLLESAGDEKSALEKIVLKLRGQLGDLERIDLERKDLETKVKALEAQLKEKTKQENLLTNENAKMKHKIDDLQNENSNYGLMEDDYNKVRSKFNEMEQLKTKAQLAITPLRAKVLRLAQKCKAKDDLLHEVVSALHAGSGGHDVLPRADAALAQSASDEYNRPISPITAKALTEFEKECSTSSAPITPSPVLSLRIPHTALEDLSKTPHPAPRRPPRKHQRHNSLETTSESDETTGSDNLDNMMTYLSLQPVSQLPVMPLGGSKSPTRLANGHHGPKYQHNGLVPMAEMYRAVKDYEPEHFSRSGHQRLELPLKEGDVVKVLGPQDDRGYFEAQVGGKVGLVPISYLMPLPSPPSRSLPGKKTSRPHSIATTGMDTSPEQILAMHQQLQRAHTPNHHVASVPSIMHPAFARALSPRQPNQTVVPSRQNGSMLPHSQGHAPAAPLPVSAPVVPPTSPRHAPPSGPLDPPTNLRIQRTVGDHSLLVSWTPPALDELARNHGTVVKGYKIYINSKDRQTIPSPHMTKALIEKLNLHRVQSFSIQTVGENGRVSRLTDTVMFEDVLPDDGESQNGDDSVVSSAVDSSAERRVHVALYDYIPSSMSPHPSQHLTFNAGEIIVTYGNVRPDGLYNGKVHGKKGLVPASFIEEVAILKSKGRRSMSTSSAASLFSPPLSVTGSSSNGGGPRSASRQSITSSASGRRNVQKI